MRSRAARSSWGAAVTWWTCLRPSWPRLRPEDPGLHRHTVNNRGALDGRITARGRREDREGLTRRAARAVVRGVHVTTRTHDPGLPGGLPQPGIELAQFRPSRPRARRRPRATAH